MKSLVSLLVQSLLLGLSAVAIAHVGDPVYLGGISAERLATMKVDGDLSDWAWFPRDFIWERDEFPLKGGDDLINGLVTADNFYVIAYRAWSPADNMLHLAAQKTDNIPFWPEADIHCSYKEDRIHFTLNPSHSGGNYRPDCRIAQQTFWTPDEQKVWAYNIYDDLAAWMYNAPYVETASVVDRATGSYTWEMALALWDEADRSGPQASIRHMIEPGKIIGGQFSINDRDSADWAVGVGTPASGPIHENADGLADLTPVSPEDTEMLTAVGSDTWGRIKATFTK